MSPSPDTTTVLQDLAAGRIDAAEAARRLDALQHTGSTSPQDTPSGAAPAGEPAPVAEPPAAEPRLTEPPLTEPPPTAEASPAYEPVVDDAWAVETDRPQRATHRRDEFPRNEPPSAQTSAEPPVAPAPSSSGHPEEPEERTRSVNTSGVERISVRAVGRRVRIVGEPSVATLSADGPHVLRRNGAVLEVSSDGEIGASLDGFSILRAPRNLDDLRSLGLGKELFLRVNPNIVVDVEVTAGSLNTERVPHLGKIRVTAGGAKLLDVTEVNDALVQAGQATVKGAFTRGRSRIRAESGSLTIELADSSNVTIKGDSQLGKVSWSGAHTGAGDEVVMGHGNARLDVEVVMGHAQVRAGSTAESGAA